MRREYGKLFLLYIEFHNLVWKTFVTSGCVTDLIRCTKIFRVECSCATAHPSLREIPNSIYRLKVFVRMELDRTTKEHYHIMSRNISYGTSWRCVTVKSLQNKIKKKTLDECDIHLLPHLHQCPWACHLVWVREGNWIFTI